MNTAQLGDRVRIHYASVRKTIAPPDQPLGHRELEFTVGTGGMIPTISLGVVGMAQGDHKQFTLQPHEIKGAAQPRLIREIPRQRLPKDLLLEVGQRLTAVQKVTGKRRQVTVVEVKPDSVVVDEERPLSRKVVVLDVTLISLDSSANANQTKPQFDAGGEG
jgi:FKBP-type peptidyl-prolyl cis-trans isomerase SlpA